MFGAISLLFKAASMVDSRWEMVVMIPAAILCFLTLPLYFRFSFAVDSILQERRLSRGQRWSRNAFIATMFIIALTVTCLNRGAIWVPAILAIVIVHRVGAVSVLCPFCNHPTIMHDRNSEAGVVVCSGRATIREFGFDPRESDFPCGCMLFEPTKGAESQADAIVAEPEHDAVKRDG